MTKVTMTVLTVTTQVQTNTTKLMQANIKIQTVQPKQSDKQNYRSNTHTQDY